MSNLGLLLGGLLIGAIVLAILEKKTRFIYHAKCLMNAAPKRQVLDGDQVPESLRGAELVMASKTLRIKEPINTQSKLDQVWAFDDEIIIANTDTRKSVKPEDIEKMSVQRILLEANDYGEVSDVAYVRLKSRTNRVHWQPVRLKNRELSRDLLIKNYRSEGTAYAS